MRYLTIFSLSMLSVAASAFAANEGGKGGGGVYRNGEYLTVGSAKLHLSPLRYAEIPGLPVVEDFTRRIWAPASAQGKLLSAVIPSGDRNYFAIDQAGGAVLARVRREYAAAFPGRLPSDKIVVYALTVGRDTYLLPKFFKLGAEERQAAILFHEAVWVLHPELELRKVLTAEARFENAVFARADGFYDRDLYESLRTLLDDNYLAVTAAAIHEFGRNGDAGPASLRSDLVYTIIGGGAMDEQTGKLDRDAVASNLGQLARYSDLFYALYNVRDRIEFELEDVTRGGAPVYYPIGGSSPGLADFGRAHVDEAGTIYLIPSLVRIMEQGAMRFWEYPRDRVHGYQATDGISGYTGPDGVSRLVTPRLIIR